ncbi:hypothetical protein TrVE_jg2261 [Triparma verrucosa]|uniref:AAA+ ATPase domain-containing protein n=1 Tax=Triparma verrucosa TaxID=1606542 RepID=A0A9W7KT35_9STRA|nr:hypothetical protein TrVE_jg2261 [Triparma verrucosa]
MSAQQRATAGKFILELGLTLAFAGAVTYIARELFDNDSIKLQTSQKSGKTVVQRLEDIRKRRKEELDDEDVEKQIPLKPLTLNSYEIVIAESVIDPSTLPVTFSSIGGLTCKAEIYDLVVLPLLRPDLFLSGNVEVTRGILLYGKPGTGKTMLAKAVAKEGKATFINVQLSVIMNKYFGESQKAVSAVFSLARKLSPSVVFIDEIDTFLQQRNGDESALSSMKSEFLTLWDGINSDESKMVMVLGATNRPYDVDTAILRRMPRTFEIGLPDVKGRSDILALMMEGTRVQDGMDKVLEDIAKVTNGFSGSDLKELVRCAKMEPIRELTKAYSEEAVKSKKKKKFVGPPKGTKVRPVSRKDFETAIRKVQKTGDAANNYKRRENAEVDEDDRNHQQQGIDMRMLAQIMAQMTGAMGGNRNPRRGNGVDADEDDDLD